MIAFITCLELILVIAFGRFLKYIKFFTEETISQINNFVFTIAFPMSILVSFYGKNISYEESTKYILVIITFFIIQLIYSLGAAKLLEKERKDFVSTANCLYRGNFIILGFPLINALLGEEGMALTGIAVVISQLFYNITTVSLYSTLEESEKVKIREVFVNVLKNPMALSGIIGFLIMIANINLGFLYNPLKLVGSVGSPLALLCLGYSLEFSYIKKFASHAMLITFLKLIIFPSILVVFINILNIEYIYSVILLILFGAPTAVNTFTFAKKYNSNIELVGSYVVLSTIVFTATIPIWIYILNII